MQRNIAITSFLIAKPPTPITPLTGEPKITFHGAQNIQADGPSDNQVNEIGLKITNLVIDEVKKIGTFTAMYPAHDSDSSAHVEQKTSKQTDVSDHTMHQMITHPPGTLAVVYHTDVNKLGSEQHCERYTVWYVGEKIERGWVSKSTVPILHCLGYFIVFSAPVAQAPGAVDNRGRVIDSAITQLQDIQNKIDNICERAASNLATITALTAENMHLRQLLSNINNEPSGALDTAPEQNKDTAAQDQQTEHIVIDLPAPHSSAWDWMNDAPKQPPSTLAEQVLAAAREQKASSQHSGDDMDHRMLKAWFDNAAEHTSQHANLSFNGADESSGQSYNDWLVQNELGEAIIKTHSEYVKNTAEKRLRDAYKNNNILPTHDDEYHQALTGWMHTVARGDQNNNEGIVELRIGRSRSQPDTQHNTQSIAEDIELREITPSIDILESSVDISIPNPLIEDVIVD